MRFVTPALLLATLALPFGSAQAVLITLDASNNFTDVIEPGVTLFRSDAGGTALLGEGPIRSTGLLIACGSASEANFSLGVTQLGRGVAVQCPDGFGYRPRNIVNENLLLTVRSDVSGLLYEIDLLNWTDRDERCAGLCTDGDATPFMYQRTLVSVPEPSTLLLLSASLLAVAANRRRRTAN
jgi:hypothetical protein